MNITLDKALLWLIPYLYLVSIAYYWGYWGSFDIDAFNYYATSDLVKGVTAPLANTFFIVASVLVVVNVSRYMMDKIATGKYFWVAVILFIMATVALVYHLFYPSPEGPADIIIAGNYSNRKLYFLLTGIATMLTVIINERLPKVDRFEGILRYSGIFFLFLMPCRANIEGRQKAWLIQNNFTFDYVITDSIPTPKREIYKYLGKAGEYHILLTRDNIKRIISSSGKLDPLVMENFSLIDTASIHRYRAHEQQLRAVILPQKALSPLILKTPQSKSPVK